jgi:flavin-dependent dehydrogenase
MVRDFPPGGTRSGTVFPIENERMIVNLGGACKDYPPTDEAGFLEFARTLINPAIYDAIKDAEPVSNINGYRRTENHWLHYEELPRWPEGLVVVGDAACGFNPVYGQGMSVAGMDALALDKSLRRSDWSARGFQRTLAQVVRTPWLLATAEDARVVGVEGAQRGPTDAIAHAVCLPLRPTAGLSRLE